MTRRARQKTAAFEWRAIRAMALAVTPLVGIPSMALAQSDGSGRTWTLSPAASLRQTLTDNYQASSDGESDAITQATVSVRLLGTGSRVRGSLEYSLSSLLYARHSEENDLQNTLNGVGTAELVDNWAFVDLAGSISQQQISAFGPTATDPSLASGNRSETRTFSVSPYIQGELGSLARYEARLNYGVNRSSSFSAANSKSTGGRLSLRGGDTQRTLAWSMSASRDTVDYDSGTSTETDTLRGTLSYPLMSSLVLTGIGGTEWTDLQSPEKKSYEIAGLQLDWVPSERTKLSARYEKRFFGSSHAVSFTFRTPRTVWNFIDSRDVSTGGPNGRSGGITVYDLLFQQFASAEPDLLRRDLLVREVIAIYGLNPNSTAIPGFLTASPTLQRVQSLSLALMGIRSTVVFQATRTSSRQLQRATDTGDDFGASNSVHQRGFNANWSHRLTQQSSINTTLGWVRSTGEFSSQRTSVRSLSAGWTTRLSPRADLGVSARYSQSSGTTQFTERALIANFGYQF
ncbi:TIGR03016 family PEP-CTERM system-associated outer membrane protein [Aquincola sp. MAHUQ-54]|uniref:TIGR03016 family PEP-CTERM system-associated outer membrane protein n=1 Tax=Aquincola agrisoli TaxID=3119538 RepID=A0AAW9QHZ1_9BURK